MDDAAQEEPLLPVVRRGVRGVGGVAPARALGAAGEFHHPEGLGLGGGRLFVADKDNNRIVVLKADTLKWQCEAGRFGRAQQQLMCTCRPASATPTPRNPVEPCGTLRAIPF